MLGCSTVCPNCKHEFACCPPPPQPSTKCPSSVRRSLHVLSGGGLINPPTAKLAPPSSPIPSPQISPSAPLAFVMPPFVGAPLAIVPPKPETELQRLSDTVRALRLSGWYYEGLTYQESNALLMKASVGAFLVRNSSDPRFLFSLSVQTDRGPTSVRLFYDNGYFRLDAQAHLESIMPLFPSVIELVEHYVRESKLFTNNPQVWVDNQGKWYSSIALVRPLMRTGPSSLKHLARMSINKALKSTTTLAQLELPSSLTAYMEEYQHLI